MLLVLASPICLLFGYPVLWYLFYTWLRREGRTLTALGITVAVQAVCVIAGFVMAEDDGINFLGPSLGGIVAGAVAGWLIYLVYRNPRLPD